MADYCIPFEQISLDQVPLVGGKNASLGEMFQHLTASGIKVPDGFATSASAYEDFINENNLRENIQGDLQKLNREDFSNLNSIGLRIRSKIMQGQFSKLLSQSIRKGFGYLTEKYGSEISLAVRSSATAEDLPEASFAGQQETYLNITTVAQLLKACKQCFASLFTDRAIKYREDKGFEHSKVALSVGVQIMVNADRGCSGVIFTLDPDSGFDQVVHIAGVWGIGENIVQGTVNPDEFYLFKPTLQQNKAAIIQRKLGSKLKTMRYAHGPETGLINTDTSLSLQDQYVLSDKEVQTLAKWALIIEEHYGRAMDIEWAKDGNTHEMFILQARPETVHSTKKNKLSIIRYKLAAEGNTLCKGSGLGNRIAKGKARILTDPKEAHKLQVGDVLVTTATNPDWDPILRKAAAIVTDQGGRTSHAAIVAREMGAVAVVGTGDATKKIQDGQPVTVSCAEGNEGVVYKGLLQWEEKPIDIGALRSPKTKPMLILADPQQAFKLATYPQEGIGLMRMEFVINNNIRVHPLALKYFDRVSDPATRSIIENLCRHHPKKEDFFIDKLAEGIATIAASVYPKQVIVRMSDFKSNEYANLIGGSIFEPVEANPMLGFRGASRYYHELYKAGFIMECEAIKMVRMKMGFTNVKVMIPFCRTPLEAKRVLEIMESNGLVRGKDQLQIYMMAEIPSNVIQAREFAQFFDGFSIGSNDLTQLTLGVDRDSQLLSEVFNVNDESVKEMIRILVKSAKETNTTVGLCGQAPSDYPEFAQFLVELGIDSISFNPDALFAGINNINQAETTVMDKPSKNVTI